MVAVSAASHGQATPMEKAWYSPQELLPALARRAGIRWAMPETLAGRAWAYRHKPVGIGTRAK
jgi:hypothetical protein